MKRKTIFIVFLAVMSVLGVLIFQHMNAAKAKDAEITLLKNGYHYKITDNEIAEYLDYSYDEKSIYIAGLKVFEEFSTPEFGFSNEGSVLINDEDNVLEFNMTKATGSMTGALDGPEVHFIMEINTKNIVSKEFTPAPDYMAAGKSEFSQYSNSVLELSKQRMVEIGTFFIEQIERMDEEIMKNS